MAFGDNWHLRSRARECAATETPFTNGQQIITAIFPDPQSSGYVRKDFSMEGWKNLADDAEKPFSFWKTTFASTAAAEKLVAEKLSAEEILRRLIEEDEDHTENTRYILAVMLERQKLLRETDSQRTPNGIIRVYEHKKTGEVMIVRDPDIPLAEIEKVQEEVVVLLENNGRVPEPEHPEDAAAAVEASPEETTTEASGEDAPAAEAADESPASDEESESADESDDDESDDDESDDDESDDDESDDDESDDDESDDDESDDDESDDDESDDDESDDDSEKPLKED